MPPVVIDLGNLNDDEGFALIGDRPDDRAGASVSGAGDINGDGIDDFIVGTYGGGGRAYVIYGTTGPRPDLDLANLTASEGFLVQDTTFISAHPVSAAGDVNGDGIDDLIFGAAGRSGDGNVSGEVFVIFGRAGTSRPTLQIANFSANDGFVIRGDRSGDYAGRTVSNVGDINGDGIDDLILGAPRGDDASNDAGEAYVIYGKIGATRDLIDLTNLSSSDGFIIRGETGTSLAAYSVSGAGDINGDGINDLIIGVPYDYSGGRAAGEAYVIYGNNDPGRTRGNINLTNLAASDGFAIQGDNAGDQAGSSVSYAGDVNGDGIDDIIIGAKRGESAFEPYSGEVFIIYGRSDPGRTRDRIDLTNLNPADGFTIQGDSGFDFAGSSVSNAGDVNGDGIDDIIFGARSGRRPGTDDRTGEAYVIFGILGTDRGLLDLTNMTASDGFVLQGNATSDDAGSSVSSAGDVNNDGIDDVIVGAIFGDLGGNDAGQAYVVYGSLEAGAVGGTSAGDLLTGSATADAIYGLAGNDLLYGDLGNDRLFGADGSDALFGQAGNDIVSGGADSDKLDGGADNDIVTGGSDGDSMRGGDGDDVLDGGAGSDAMNGGTGVDIFTGGEGRDKFRFRDGDTGNSIATADRITDLDQAQGERISLTLMDAIVGGADDAFTFIGTAAFGNVAGQLRYELIGGNTYVMGDTDGDGTSDFMIRIDGALVLTGADFSL